MKLAEALKRLQSPTNPDAKPFTVILATGFEPLHLKTFLMAHLKTLFPTRKVEVGNGLYGDVAGTLEAALRAGQSAIALVLEWPDFDPRLGLRRLGGWRPSLLNDIAEEVRKSTERILGLVQGAPEGVSLAVSMPSLPLPPVFYQPGCEAGAIELGIRETLARFIAELSVNPRVKVVSSQRLDHLSPAATRHDIRSELAVGFPYALPHASVLASLLAQAIQGKGPKKGIVTDLDDTLWRGILGEDGVEGISWELDRKSQMHGVYQQFLASLAEAGILIGVASKNSPGLVEEAFQRQDLHIRRESLFPVKASWEPKSKSIEEILAAWNIGAADVVFIDDSPMEIAQVSEAFPGMTCLQFPTHEDKEILDLLWRLRDLFGKNSLTEEDRLRMQSLKTREKWVLLEGKGPSLDTLLQEAQPEITLDFASGRLDSRAFELINKTNQFNLNGKRLTESDWGNAFRREQAFLLTANYKDKYGQLGKIAAILGEISPSGLKISHWVMSCRAFSRRIEYYCLDALFNQFDVQSMELDFCATDRNQPIQDLLSGLQLESGQSRPTLTRTGFKIHCPSLKPFERSPIHD